MKNAKLSNLKRNVNKLNSTLFVIRVSNKVTKNLKFKTLLNKFCKADFLKNNIKKAIIG